MEGDLVLPVVPSIDSPNMIVFESPQSRNAAGWALPAEGPPQGDKSLSSIREEVAAFQGLGHQRIAGQRADLLETTKKATGASAQSADDVKEW